MKRQDSIIIATSDDPGDPEVWALVIEAARRERPQLWSRAWRLMAEEQDRRVAAEAAAIAEADAA